jgi:MFS transporter, DHA1 family, tetracycline resistance protein
MIMRSLPGAIWALLLVNFVGSLGFTITLPLMPYYAATFGADPLTVGMLSASYAVFALVAGPILGQLSDRHGRRPWLLFSQLGTVIGFALTAVGGSLWMLFLGRIIDGISGGNQVIAQAYIGDVARPEERTRVYGLMGASFGLGAIVGPVLGGALSAVSYALPFWVAAAIGTVALLVTARYLPESRPAAADHTRTTINPVRQLLDLATAPELLRPLSLYAVMALVFGLFVASIGLFMQLQLAASPVTAGLMVGYYGVVSVAMQLLVVGRAATTLGERGMVAVGLSATAASLAILAFAGGIPATMLGVSVLVFGMGLLRPAVMSLISGAAGPQRQGATMGATQSLQSLADIIAPLVAGALIAAGTPGLPFVAGAVVALAGLLVARLPAGAAAPVELAEPPAPAAP